MLTAALMVAIMACPGPPPTDDDDDEQPPGPEALQLLTSILPRAYLGAQYEQLEGTRLLAEGGTPPYTYQLRDVAPELDWLGVDPSTGQLSGTPGEPTVGDFQLTARVQDGAAGAAERALTLEIRSCEDGDEVPCSLDQEGVCHLGTRVCADGVFAACGDVEPSIDELQCGEGCGPCPNGFSCLDGSCKCGLEATCGASEACCDDGVETLCADLSTSVDDCGACGLECVTGLTHATTSCDEGACQYTCEAGFGRCDQPPGELGCLTDLHVETAHCGACGNACDPPSGPGVAACSAGSCEMLCDSGFTLCGTRCVDVESDLAHCGSCDAPCPESAPNVAAFTCEEGGCVPTCEENWADCDGDPLNGCEVDLLGDDENCGACGNGCVDPETCEVGVCWECMSCGGISRCCGVCFEGDPPAVPASCAPCTVFYPDGTCS